MQHFDPTTDEKRSSSHGGPRVRIRLPPAASPVRTVGDDLLVLRGNLRKAGE
jgi:hypothetical protein